MPVVIRRSKRYKKAAEKAIATPVAVEQAIDVVKQFPPTKFDQSVELIFSLGIDPKQADQMIRGAVSLPKGVGKTKKVIAFCPEELTEKAKAAGAIEAGADDLIKKVSDGWADFDVAVAHPAVMGKVGK